MNESEESLDIDALEVGWRGATPPREFARTVIARLEGAAPPVATRPARSWLVAAFACGCVVLVAILASGSHPAKSNPAIATIEQQTDLGIHRD